MDTPRCVIFDFGNVVGRFDKSVIWNGLSQLTGDHLPAPVPAVRVEEVIVGGGLERSYDRGEIDTTEFTRRVCRVLGLKDTAVQDVEKCWRMPFTPNHPVLDLIRLIRARGECRLVLASNTNPLHAESIRAEFREELSLFDAVVMSFEVGWVKPERGFFERCFAAAGCDPAQCVYVDDLRPFCETAQRGFGVEAVWYNPRVDLRPALAEVGVFADADHHPPERERLLQVYQQRFLHYRHLDSLRWQVPLLVVALGGALLGFIDRQGGGAGRSSVGVAWLLTVFGVFALLCSYYLSRISRHHETNTVLLQWAARRLGDWGIPSSTTARLPIRSAAFWFAYFILALSGGFLGAGIYSFALHFRPVGEWWGVIAPLAGALSAVASAAVMHAMRRRREESRPGERLV